MNKEEITKELDKFEIQYDKDANKPALEELLNTQLALRAGGDDPPENVKEEDDLLEIDQPVMSDEERSERLASAQIHLAENETALEDLQTRLLNVRKEIATLLPKTTQATLAQCVSGLHDSVKADIAVKAEVGKLVTRFKKEAEKLLSTDEQSEE